MDFLNYHHLRYFWVVAREGSLRKASEKLRVSQPTISEQIAALEHVMGDKLFHRGGRGLTLTETGHQAFSYADEIFSLGQEFLQSMKQQPTTRPLRVNIGVADALPKIMTHEIVRPIFHLDKPVHAVFSGGKVSDLLTQMAIFRLNVVLADEPATGALPVKAFNHHLGSSGVTFCAEQTMAAKLARQFPRSLHGQPMLLPTSGTALRRAIDKWLQENGVVPRVVAEYDDAALMKAAAADRLGCFPMPTAALDEALSRYRFKVIAEAQGCSAEYYAITAGRKLTHPAVVAITSNARGALFGSAPRAGSR